VMDRLQEHGAAFSRLRLRFGGAVIAAFFRQLIPDLPEQRWQREKKHVSVPAGGGWEAVKPGAECRRGTCPPLKGAAPSGLEPFVVWEGAAGEGLMVRDEEGAPLPVVKGAIRIYDAQGRVLKVVPNATLKASWDAAPGRSVVSYFQWTLGPADWGYCFRRFVSVASIYSRGAVNDLTGAALAAMLGETRAAMSARKRKELECYQQATGGKAVFAGMRGGVDPRKGKRKMLKAETLKAEKGRRGE
nr:hypothetical protein [Verrucomicrobiales bacterium]